MEQSSFKRGEGETDMAQFGNADISFLVFEDENGWYRLKGVGPVQEMVKVYLSEEEVALEVAKAMVAPCLACGKPRNICDCDNEE
jgi:hypothetical protein